MYVKALLKEKNLLIPAAAGSSPSMQLLVFWPPAGAFGPGRFLSSAKLVGCELGDMKN